MRAVKGRVELHISSSMKPVLKTFLFLALIIFLTGCAHTPAEIAHDASKDHIRKARGLSDTGHYREAIEEFKLGIKKERDAYEACKNDPYCEITSSETYYRNIASYQLHMGICYMQLGQYDLAMEMYYQSRDVLPELAEKMRGLIVKARGW